MTTAARRFICDDCSLAHPLNELVTLCPSCGGLLEVEYDLDLAADLRDQALKGRGDGMWRWRKLLPLPGTMSPVTLGEGDSPLLETPDLARRLKIKKLFVKNDGLMPTGSFKDRGFALAVSFAKHLGERTGFTYSSGNAGAAFAAYCTRAGIDATVFVEAGANDAKVALITLHMASVFRLDYSSSTEIYEALSELSRRGHYSYVNFINPIRHEAMKVYAYEICESLNWKAPDVVVHPVGTGGGLWGAWKGFLELRELGIINQLPRMIGVQPAACAPLADAFETGRTETRRVGEASRTIAQSIAGDSMLQGGRRVLRAIRDSGGAALGVDEEAIIQAIRELGAAGVGAEPSAAVSYAALQSARRDGWIGGKDRVVSVITGAALKQPGSLLDAAPAVIGRVQAQANAMEQTMKRGRR